MTEQKQARAWAALSQICYLGEGEATLTRAAVGPYFDNLLAAWQIANDHGLTRIREICRDEDGFETSVVFNQVLTETGKALVEGPPPQYTPTSSEERHAEMEIQRNAERIRLRAGQMTRDSARLRD